MDELVLEICRAEGLDARRVEPLSGGQVNRVFRIDDQFVVRIGARADAFQRLEWETGLLRRLAGQVPVPRVLAFGQRGETVYQVQALVRGQKLYSAWKELRPAAREGIVAELAAALQALHALSFENLCCPRGAQPGVLTWPEFVRGELERALAEIKALGIRMAPGFVELAREAVLERLPALQGGAPVLVHGDCWLGNILVEQEHISAILDFEYALLAPPDHELAKMEDFCLYPDDYTEEGGESFCAADFAGFFPLLRRYYPALFAVDHLRERLDAYHLVSALSDYLSWRKENIAAIPPGRMAAKGFYMARISNFTFRHGARLISA